MASVATFGVDDMGDFLIEKAIPPNIVTAFTENQIDGECFLELSETEVKELVKPLGIAKKIIRIIKEITVPSQNASPDGFIPSSQHVEVGSPPCIDSPSPSRSEVSTISVPSSVASPALSPTDKGFLNFTIPTKWRPSIMAAIEEKKLSPDIRNEVVRDLVTHMYGYVEKPSSSFCKFVAQRLILKYSFMRDTKGTGYGSWEKKLCDRLSNVMRKRKAEADLDSTPCKRGRPKKVAVCLDDRYPALNQMAVNPEEERAASEALNREMTNDKPRRSVFLPLMKTTFTLRRHYILHDASSVQDIIKKYPALKETSSIEQDMELILSRPGVFRTFTSEWREKWVPAIISYCRGLRKKEIVDVFLTSETSGEECEERLALSLLVTLFTPKKCANALNSVYEKCLIGEDPTVVAIRPPVRNSPRFAEFVVEDGCSTYFLFVEQSIVCEIPTFSKALFFWFCIHYVFHLAYSSSLTELCTFFQEFVFGLPSAGKRSSNYLTTATDIQQQTLR